MCASVVRCLASCVHAAVCGWFVYAGVPGDGGSCPWRGAMYPVFPTCHRVPWCVCSRHCREAMDDSDVGAVEALASGRVMAPAQILRFYVQFAQEVKEASASRHCSRSCGLRNHWFPMLSA